MSYRRYVGVAVSVLAVVVGGMTWFISGCPTAIVPGGGGGGGAGGLSLSSARLNPGQFLTLSQPSIVAGSTVNVRFEGPDGYRVTVEGFETEDGSVTVAVPPLVNPTDGQFRAGQVMVSIEGSGEQQPLLIEDLLELDGVEPGALLRLVLQNAIDNYQATLADLALIEDQLNDAVDSAAAVAAIQQEIQSLQAMIAQLDATGTLVVDLTGIGSVTLGGEELATADRVLFSMLAGVSELDTGAAGSKQADRLNKSSGIATRKTAADCLDEPPERRADCLQQVVNEIVKDTGKAANLASMLATGVGLTITVAGLVVAGVAASPEVALTGLIVAVMGGGMSYTSAGINQQNTDSYFNNDPTKFNRSLEATSQLIRVGTSAAGNLPVVGAPAQVVNVGLSVKDLVNGAKDVKCSQTGQKSVNRQEIFDVVYFCQYTPPSEDAGGEEGVGCTNTCAYANDGYCDDGGTGSDYEVCAMGTDCADCGPRSGTEQPGVDTEVLGACCLSGTCQTLSASDCAFEGGVYQGDGSPCTACQAPTVEYVIWYTGNVCCFGAPLIYISTRDSFNMPESAASYPGGGIDYSVPLVKVEFQGGFDSADTARAWICPQFTSSSYHYWCLRHYQMGGKNWQPGGLDCDFSNLPETETPPDVNGCQ